MKAEQTSLIEEIANSITHGLGLLLAMIGIVVLFLINTKSLEFWKTFGLGVFSLSIILVYTFSTLYHSLYYTRAKTVFKRLDHSSIFLLIAGTYTPFILILLKSQSSLVVLLILWLLAISGIIFKTIFISSLKRLGVFIYLFLGWIGVLMLGPVITMMPAIVIILLILGGCFYTFGTIFYSLKRLKFNHGIWHLFVLCGTASHFVALLNL